MVVQYKNKKKKYNGNAMSIQANVHAYCGCGLITRRSQRNKVCA